MHENDGLSGGKVLNLYCSDSSDWWKSYTAMRPTYPTELFDRIAEYMQKHNSSGRDLCIDYGSGTGTAVPGLLDRCAVKKVIAADKNKHQFGEAVTYLSPMYGQDRFNTIVGSAGYLDMIPDHSVSLVTAGEACHWFDRPKWLQEVTRVLKPSGTLAFWVYPPQLYIISHPDAVAPCNRAFQRLFATNLAKVNLAMDKVLVTLSLCDNVILDPDHFVHQVRYKWLLPKSVSNKVERDAELELTYTTSYTDEEASAGLHAAPDGVLINTIPERPEEMPMRYSRWTTKHLLSYMSTLGLATDEAFDDEAFKTHVSEIESVVGGPEGTFDVGWPLGLVLATRVRNGRQSSI